jgi:hypothetical protein
MLGTRNACESWLLSLIFIKGKFIQIFEFSDSGRFSHDL